jgi:hypothetical protein
MEKQPFHIWAPVKIAKLRSEASERELAADHLQNALDMYLGSDDAGEPEEKPSKAGDLLQRVRMRTSRYEPVFQAFERNGRPLSLDDMMEIGRANGFQIDRDNMRSLAWGQVQRDRAKREGELYVWGLSNAEPKPPEEEVPVQP